MLPTDCPSSGFAGAGFFNPDNTTFGLEQKADPGSGTPSSFSVAFRVPGSKTTCTTTYTPSETAGFNAEEGSTKIVFNNTCKPGKPGHASKIALEILRGLQSLQIR
jgi:hypothetical protein